MSTQTYQIRSGSDLGRVVRDARADRGLTQQQVVDQLEVNFDRTRLARIEAGEGFQSFDRALNLLRRLGVDVVAMVPFNADQPE
jgi:transcriptional regulator with XRE-family HTH domain